MRSIDASVCMRFINGLVKLAPRKVFTSIDFHHVRGSKCKNKAFCSPGTQNGRRVIKVY